MAVTKKKKRNYRKEYDNYHKSKKQKDNRVARNRSRRQLEREKKVRKGDGMDVHHVDGNPKNGKRSNLRVVAKKKNRSFSRKTRRT